VSSARGFGRSDLAGGVAIMGNHAPSGCGTWLSPTPVCSSPSMSCTPRSPTLLAWETASATCRAAYAGSCVASGTFARRW